MKNTVINFVSPKKHIELTVRNADTGKVVDVLYFDDMDSVTYTPKESGTFNISVRELTGGGCGGTL